MPEPVIKICGIRTVEHAQTSATAGATAIGFMFAPSKRQIDPESAREIAASLPPRGPLTVGVFVNAGTAEMLAARDTVALDVLQLSGDETVSVLGELGGVRVWKALRFAPGTDVDAARRALDPWLGGALPVERVLVDAAVAGAYGGTGHRADWELFALLAADYPLVLAGGLTPENIKDAISKARPVGVDVSSGVEIDGRKDSALIHSFVERAWQAFQS